MTFSQLDGVADVSGSVVDTPYKERKSLEQVESALSPLIQQIERQAANSSVILQLDKMVRLAAERRYADAGAAYMQLALGNKKWNNTLASYGGASGTNKGGEDLHHEAGRLAGVRQGPRRTKICARHAQ